MSKIYSPEHFRRPPVPVRDRHNRMQNPGTAAPVLRLNIEAAAQSSGSLPPQG